MSHTEDHQLCYRNYYELTTRVQTLEVSQLSLYAAATLTNISQAQVKQLLTQLQLKGAIDDVGITIVDNGGEACDKSIDDDLTEEDALAEYDQAQEDIKTEPRLCPHEACKNRTKVYSRASALSRHFNTRTFPS